jgi:hypothetical protein
MSAFKNSVGKLVTVTAFAVWIAAAIGAIGFSAPAAYADSITPTSFSATLGVGESVTVRKTVVVDTATTTALLDVMFLFDTTGSMGGEIGAAKLKAADILTSLSGFGSLATGTGWYNDPSTLGLMRNLTTNAVTGVADINAIPGATGGGDADELGVLGIIQATAASWRSGSNRFVIAFGDAAFKGNNADAIAALNAVDATFIGVRFTGGGSEFSNDAGPISAATGGSVINATATGDSIADAIIAGITTSFATYSTVTVDDLGGGLPLIDVSTTCISAAAGGSCVGSDAVGAYTREAARSFVFDVTFTRLAAGDAAFDTFALVDRGSVASEADRFGDGDGKIPVPGTLLLLGIGFLGFALARRRIG